MAWHGITYNKLKYSYELLSLSYSSSFRLNFYSALVFGLYNKNIIVKQLRIIE